MNWLNSCRGNFFLIPLDDKRHWYRDHHLLADAIRHALAGGDFERAADLVEMAAPALHRIRQEAAVLGWMKALPEELFRARPVLSMQYVGTVMSNGGIEGVEARLRNAERWLEVIAGGSEPSPALPGTCPGCITASDRAAQPA